MKRNSLPFLTNIISFRTSKTLGFIAFNPTYGAANVFLGVVTVGVTGTILTKDYSTSTNPNSLLSRSTSLLGTSLDVTFGIQGAAEIGLGWRHLGIGLEIDENRISGISAHIGISFPPSIGYGTVRDTTSCK